MQGSAPEPRRVVSVSIGSAKRDHKAVVTIDGVTIEVSREGQDGDIERAARRFAELDGTVDALGMGGIDIYLMVDGHKYYFREAKKLARSVSVTPLVDGSGLKGALEKGVVEYMRDELGLELADKKVLLPSAIDRWGMADGFHEAGSTVIIGDLTYTLGIPLMLYSWNLFRVLVRLVFPLATQLPFSWLYPVGAAQEGERAPNKKMERIYRECDIIAGDWQYVKKYMPHDMDGTWVVTNTTTDEDVEFCRERGVELLVTSTPRFDGRSFGTNVLEAILVALEGSAHELSTERYQELLKRIGCTPDVQWLQEPSRSCTQSR